MAILGIRDLQTISLPEAWDANEILKVRLASGETFAQFLSDLRDALPMINQGLVSGQLAWIGNAVAFQDTPEVKYPVGTKKSGVRVSTELSDAFPYHGKTSGHMLPLVPYERGFGWSRIGLMEATREDLDADISSAVHDITIGWQTGFLRRLFQKEPDTVGNSGISPGFADGGLAISDYAPPPSTRGERFDKTHNHYLRLAALDDNAVKQAVHHLWEHGHSAPYNVIASEADRATWASLDGWVKPAVPGVQVALTETRATSPDLSPFDGYYDTGEFGLARVMFSPKVPGGYFGVYKAYGLLARRNPLRVRWNRNIGVGWRLWPAQALMKRGLAMFYAQYGFGVGEDRTNGVLVRIAGSGEYTSPVIED